MDSTLEEMTTLFQEKKLAKVIDFKEPVNQEDGKVLKKMMHERYGQLADVFDESQQASLC